MVLLDRIIRFMLAVAVVFSVGPGVCRAVEADDRIGLIDAWQKVIAENDQLLAMGEEVTEARHRQEAAADLYWPEVGLSVGYLYGDDDITLSPSQLLDSTAGGAQIAPVLSALASSYGMTAAQLDSALTSTIADRQQVVSSVHAFWPIYTGGRIAAAQDAARGRLREADHRLQNGARDQFEKLIVYYFSVVLARQVLDTRIEAEDGLRRHRDHARLLEQHGQIPSVERLQSEASYDKATVERKKALRDLEIAQVALSRLLKREEPAQPTDALFLNESLPPVQEFIDRAVSRHPGIMILEAKREQAEALVKAERGRYYPTLGLFGNYIIYEEDNLATELTPDWLVGVSMSVPLIDRSGRSGLVSAAQSSLRRVDLLIAQMKSDLIVQVEQNYRHAEQALEEYLGLRSSLALAEQTVSLRGKSFNQGMSTSLDVVDAELFRAAVKTQRSVAAYNYVVALAGLCGASGEPEQFFVYQKSHSTGAW